jgi:signal peptidase
MDHMPAHSTQDKALAHRSAFHRVWGGLGTLCTLVMVVIATLAVVVAVMSHFSPAGKYTVLGHPVLSVLSGSMSPTIKTGDLVYDRPVTLAEAEHLRVGQIITFRATAGKTFTHRIHAVQILDGSVVYQTKGDANNAPDQPLVAPSQVVGLYEGKVPFGGYVLNALHKPLAVMLLVAAPLLWLLATWLFALAKEGDAKPPAVPRREEVPVM